MVGQRPLKAKIEVRFLVPQQATEGERSAQRQQAAGAKLKYNFDHGTPHSKKIKEVLLAYNRANLADYQDEYGQMGNCPPRKKYRQKACWLAKTGQASERVLEVS